MSVYRTASPPPPEPIVIVDGSSVVVENVSISLKCEGCGAEWVLHDAYVLPRDTAAFNHLQIAWGLHHGKCR